MRFMPARAPSLVSVHRVPFSARLGAYEAACCPRFRTPCVAIVRLADLSTLRFLKPLSINEEERKPRLMTSLTMPTDPHPRPQLERDGWISLNGLWDFAIDADAGWNVPCDVAWDLKIKVPFAPETSASGISFKGFFRACWYSRRFRAPHMSDGERLILHFGAVDYD